MTNEFCVPAVECALASERRGPPSALVLCAATLSTEEQRLGRLLDFFGIPWRALTAPEIARELAAPRAAGRPSVLVSAECLASAARAEGGPDHALPAWLAAAESVYVYGFHSSGPSQSVLRAVTGDSEARVLPLDRPRARMAVTSELADLCGPMSGLAVMADSSETGSLFQVTRPGKGFQSIIASGEGDVFITTTHHGTSFYLNACPRVVDLQSRCTAYFDVKKAFGESVPLVMYLKREFRGVCWDSPETSACLTVDDPPLKPRYGFLNFQEALKMMDRLSFTASIGFIPWNWKRTDRRTVQLFRDRPDRVSIAVHGCDHTAGEFAAASAELLSRRTKLANLRMEGLRQRTGIGFDPVMIFPQGSFSPEAGLALKANHFTAAVNTEVSPSGRDRNRTNIEDLWDVAIMKYGTFPIFTRRYLAHGIENFAFDALVGKPCLIAAHHDVFKDHASELAAFVEQTSSPVWRLQWRTLGSAIRHSFKMRRLADDAIEARVFASAMTLENPATVSCRAQVARAGDEAESVQSVMAGGAPAGFSVRDGRLQFPVTLPPTSSVQVRIRYFDRLAVEPRKVPLGYRLKTRARRHLSEFRDNWLSQNRLILAGAQRAKQFLDAGRKAQ